VDSCLLAGNIEKKAVLPAVDMACSLDEKLLKGFGQSFVSDTLKEFDEKRGAAAPVAPASHKKSTSKGPKAQDGFTSVGRPVYAENMARQ
jgi:hypothetical protein